MWVEMATPTRKKISVFAMYDSRPQKRSRNWETSGLIRVLPMELMVSPAVTTAMTPETWTSLSATIIDP